MQNTTFLNTCLLTLALTGMSLAQAAVSPEQAARLKTDLTPLGGERAGNADGSIPAWQGGYTQVAPGYKPGDKRPDPFAGEKPLYSIKASNMEQYAGELAEGTKLLLKKYPDYRLDVYPTHRSAAAPQWVYDNTSKNATRATLDVGSEKVSNAYGGIPFPIPENGAQVLWNYRLSWQGGDTISSPFDTWLMTAGGKKVQATRAQYTYQFPYYVEGGSLENYSGKYLLGKLFTELPSSKAGEGLMTHWDLDPGNRAAWQYLVGQRRVRRAPNIAYDTPDFVTSGVGLFDEAFMLFGPTDRYDLKLVGKKELLVAYNNNRAALAKSDDLVKANFLNPDLVRWEKHRVWVVEATLKSGKRHVVPRRTYYVDEDSWQILMADGYDAQGKLGRQMYSLTLLAPDLPALTAQVMWGSYNLDTGAYFLNSSSNDLTVQYQKVAKPSASYFTPDAMANENMR
ncbi:hypothetical protein UG46_13985 [Pseudomonas fluorescens]|uniref:DUF1329 domain-containing protein n=1 Tax=Pseudomonas frederiksbergensis TaxID=104087 RepID=A0A0B1ZA95_9PSED|nr:MULTISPECIES: DUF1329 domain-containing protein [Pseudomonas]KHK66307.1 hypothetical protein JZ00_00295 [Pseudomonas frederiksbergensis]KJH86195.1 hypothetical protein UG46_13985 [Pseudomonas fluorescens]MBI6618332.1 DUF1329 domain-containing protein [Pseudomonas corrugata]MBI6694922.1 DUF1329 domain-containing protein [Pseudomonas corrugata]